MALSPTTSAKLNNRDYANKIRHGSPKLPEILREKCRQRMREKRHQLFNEHRAGLKFDSKQTHVTLTEIVRQEFKNLTAFDQDEEMTLSQEALIELQNEITQEQEQWLLQEYEKMTRDEIESLAIYADNAGREVFCPICQKSLLTEKDNCVTCMTCGLTLTDRTLEELKYLINESVRVHTFNCNEAPTFIMIPDNNNINLYIICNDCSTLALIC